MAKSHPIYKEEYNVYLVEAEDRIYRVQIYFKVGRASTPSMKKDIYVTKVRDIYCEQIFKLNKE